MPCDCLSSHYVLVPRLRNNLAGGEERRCALLTVMHRVDRTDIAPEGLHDERRHFIPDISCVLISQPYIRRFRAERLTHGLPVMEMLTTAAWEVLA
jgi:hypothetical protein